MSADVLLFYFFLPQQMFSSYSLFINKCAEQSTLFSNMPVKNNPSSVWCDSMGEIYAYGHARACIWPGSREWLQQCVTLYVLCTACGWNENKQTYLTWCFIFIYLLCIRKQLPYYFCVYIQYLHVCVLCGHAYDICISESCPCLVCMPKTTVKTCMISCVHYTVMDIICIV